MEIEFRVWEVSTNKMFYNLAFYNDNFTSVMAQERPLLKCIPMQYTNVKDCKNVKIFKGDIILTHNKKGVVSFKDGTFILEFNSKEFPKSIPLHSLKNIKLEVIGNIYENTNLIK